MLTAGCDTGASSLEVASPSPSPSPLQVHNNLTYLTLDTVEGSTSCWVLLTCLEVLQSLALHTEPGERAGIGQYCLYTADLWNYAR